jgi:hypothetical protein
VATRRQLKKIHGRGVSGKIKKGDQISYKWRIQHYSQKKQAL